MIAVHANEVKRCKGCADRVVFLKNVYGKWGVFNIKSIGQSWYEVDEKEDKHICPQQGYLNTMKRKADQKQKPLPPSKSIGTALPFAECSSSSLKKTN
jgi:hypothetical protein